MNIYSQQIESDVDLFQSYVQKLSVDVQSVSSLWKDSKYYELANGISVIASQAKDVIVSGDTVCESIDKFFNIADEQY